MVPADWFQAKICPCSVAKMNRAGDPLRLNPVERLATCPVGSPAIETVSPILVTSVGVAAVPPLYSVDVLLWLFDTQTGEVARFDMPHALTRSGSTITAPKPARLATRLVCVTVTLE